MFSREIQDEGKVKLHYYLGVTAEQDEEHKYLMLHQKQYILNMLD